MARKVLTDLDLAKNSLNNARLQNLAADPSTPVLGQTYFNTTSNRIRTWNGTTWDEYGTGSGGGNVTQTANSGGSGRIKVSAAADKSLTDYATAGIVKSDGSGVASAAVSGTDYAPATSGTTSLKGNGSGGFSAATLNDNGAPTADFSMNSHKLTSVLDPTGAQDAATKNYVDLARQGLSIKDPVRVATTANGTLASAFANSSTVDGVTLATGDRILLKNQTTASENGIYIVAASGAPTRATDADASGELVVGTFVLVTAGTTNAGNQFTVQSTTATPWVPASSGSTWVQLTGASTVSAGAGLTASGNVFAVGAGTGISVAADSVTVDRSTNGATVPFKYSATIGDGSSTSIAVTHSLGTQDVVAQVRDASTNAVVDCDIVQTSTTVTTFSFTTAPASNAYKVVIMG